MPFNYEPQAPVFQIANQQLIEGASKSPFSIAGETMTNLNNDIQNRIYTDKASKAGSLEELSQIYNPQTKESQVIANQRMGMLGAIGQEQNRDALLQLQKNKFIQDQLQSQSVIDKNTFDLGLKQNALAQLNTDNQYQSNIAGLPEAQKAVSGLDKLGVKTQGFNAIIPMTPVQRMNQEAILGQTGTKDALAEQNDLQVAAYKAANTQRKRDALEQMEVAFYKANPNPTPEQVKDFYKRVSTKQTSGVGTVAENYNEAQLKDGQVTTNKWASQGYIKNPMSASKETIDKMYNLEVSNLNNHPDKKFYTKQKETLANNYKFVSGVNELLSENKRAGEAGLPTATKGVIDSSVQWAKERMEGAIDPQVMANINFSTKSGRLLAGYIKATSGTAASDAERAFLAGLFNADGTLVDEKVMIAKMNAFREGMMIESDDIATKSFKVIPESSTIYRQYGNTKPKDEKDTKATPFKTYIVGDKTYVDTASAGINFK